MTVAILALAVPALIAVTYVGLRRAQSVPLVRSLVLAKGADTRGIALQTVIIIVVLLAIAGAVAGVLLSRGTEATSQLEQTDVVRDAADYSSYTLCKAAGFNPLKGSPTKNTEGVWTGGTAMTDTDDPTEFKGCAP
jgi:hypothetical protein